VKEKKIFHPFDSRDKIIGVNDRSAKIFGDATEVARRHAVRSMLRVKIAVRAATPGMWRSANRMGGRGPGDGPSR